MHMSFPEFSPFPFSFAYLHIPEASLQPGHCLWGEAWRIFNLAEFSIRLSLQSLLLQTSCVPSLRLFSQSCLSLKGHLERTADVSRKDLEAVLASSCFTQKSDGFFLVNSLLTALNYTEEAEEKGEAGVEKFVWKKKKWEPPTFSICILLRLFNPKQGAADPVGAEPGRCGGCRGHRDTATAAEGAALCQHPCCTSKQD